MKRKIDYPEYQEHKSFRLTNNQRLYFGLNIIDDKWEEVEIKEGTTVFYDGTIIRKIITWDNCRAYEYTEFDTELETRDRQYVLPKTAKGKEKKITPTSLLSFMASGCKLYIGFARPIIVAYCPKNNISLPITGYEGIQTISDLKKWLDNYIKTCPDDYFEKVENMRNAPQKSVKVNIGDIFRFEIDREYYGFGIIVGKLQELKKSGIFKEGHPMLDTMTVPLLIRLYLLKTKNKNLPICEITKNKMLPTDIVSDTEFYYGLHKIVGYKDLEEDDIDFPIQLCYRLNDSNKPVIRLAWGVGMLENDNIDIIPDAIKTRNFENTGVALNLPKYMLNRALDGQNQYHPIFDLFHSDNNEVLNRVFKIMDIDIGIDFDSFNTKYNGMTRKQYIDFIYRNQ